MNQVDVPATLFTDLQAFLELHGAPLPALAGMALASGFGAWFGAWAILSGAERARRREIQSSANVAIAAMVALLGKLLNFKKDYAAPAEADARTLADTIRTAGGSEENGGEKPPEKTHLSVTLELWPDFPFELRLAHENFFAQAGGELDAIQLLKMLDYNLAELTHLVRQRNALILQMNAHQTSRGMLPGDGLRLYLRYAGLIARNVDENLFFLDRAIGKVRDSARKLLPQALHGGIADVGLKTDASALMPPKDLIKNWIG